MYRLRVEKSTKNQDDIHVWIVGTMCFFLLLIIQGLVIWLSSNPITETI